MTTWSPGPMSLELFLKASLTIPGGVNSPVRAFASVGLSPFFVCHAKGPYVFDVDNNKYIDFLGSWGPLILGHSNEKVLAALIKAAQCGSSFGAPHKDEVILSEIICDAFDSISKVRLVNSGTEATMSAIRLARGFTKKNKIIKFDGCYHGHADSFLVKAGSGAATLQISGSLGVTPASIQDTISVAYNDLEAVKKVFQKHKDQVAALIVEPVAGNMGCILPQDGFLQGLRTLCDEHHCLLIFDEVITGFRLAKGGAQEYFGVKADITTLGKILGGGMPIGAFGGSSEIMDMLAPTGQVYQAGTLSGNPIAVACAIATLEELNNKSVYTQLERLGNLFETLLLEYAQKARLNISINRVGSMMGVFLTKGPVLNYEQAASQDTRQFSKLFSSLLTKGVSIAPSAFESIFISLSHTEEIIAKAAKAFGEAFLEITSESKDINE